MMRDPEELIPVGKIIGTHGIKGQMKLHSYSGNAESLSCGADRIPEIAGRNSSRVHRYRLQGKFRQIHHRPSGL